MRQSIRQAEVEAGQRPEVYSDEPAETRWLMSEVKELRRGSEILKATSAFFAAELAISETVG